MTVARGYAEFETLETFEMMWPGLWDTIGRVSGEHVKFKFIDGEGLLAILVDGNKPQVLGCGKDLVKRVAARPDVERLIPERDPRLIVKEIVRTCTIHIDR